MDYDTILQKYVGEAGVYQVFIVLYVSAACISCTFNSIDFTLIGYTPEYRCNVGNISHLEEHLTQVEILQLTSPVDEYTGKPDACYVYDMDYSVLTVEQGLSMLSNVTTGEKHSTTECRHWVYSQDVFSSTIVSEWDLVCDQQWLLATSQAVYTSGFFTVFIGGWVADKLGRKPVAIGAFIMYVVTRVAEGLSVNFYMFTVVRFFQGVANTNLYISTFTVVVELVGPRWRVLAGQIPYVMWSVGYMILPGMAYLIRDWRMLTFVLLIFAAPYIAFPIIMPESIRWLNVKKKHKQAAAMLKQMARWNKREIPENVLVKIEIKEANSNNGNFRSLFQSRELVKITLILFFQWISASAGYYGIVYFLPMLGGNVFITTFISGALELPSLMYVYMSLDTRLGRRINSIILFTLCGLSMLVLMAIPNTYTWLIICLALLGRFMIATVFSILYIHTSEVYPTFCRTVGLSASMTVTRIGMLVAPYVVGLVSISVYLPPTIFAIFTLISGFLAWFLPETRGRNLPDDVAQISRNTGTTTNKEDLNDNNITLSDVYPAEKLINYNKNSSV